MAWSCHYATGCFVAFLGDICTLKSGWNMKKLFCCPALELFHCLPLWKTVLFVSSRAFLFSTPTFLFSTPVEKSEATWKKATKCNKKSYLTNASYMYFLTTVIVIGFCLKWITLVPKLYLRKVAFCTKLIIFFMSKEIVKLCQLWLCFTFWQRQWQCHWCSQRNWRSLFYVSIILKKCRHQYDFCSLLIYYIRQCHSSTQSET